MKSYIDRDRLKELRRRTEMSQAELEKRSGVSKDTISRIERGELPGNRRHTIDSLAMAFGVDAGVLTGDLALPPEKQPRRTRQQGSVKVDSEALNALFLVSRRYQVPMIRIVELAPLLFVLAAEGSLERRRSKLERLETAYQALGSDFPHLNTGIPNQDAAVKIFEAEAKSIEKNDILAESIPRPISAMESLSIGLKNPFSCYLHEQCARHDDGLISYHEFNREQAIYWVCEDDALAIAGGDKQAQELIARSEVMLSDMPKNLWADDALAERTAWILKTATTAGGTYNDEIVDVLDSEIEGDEP